jgi:hypothetical protein
MGSKLNVLIQKLIIPNLIKFQLVATDGGDLGNSRLENLFADFQLEFKIHKENFLMILE